MSFFDEMKKILERLKELVNYEIESTNQTILSFSVRCEVSYNEMRKICNGRAKDIKLSTICKICNNSHIQIADIFIVNKDIDVIVRYKDDRFRVRIKKC